jgi:hypothetical protein
VLTLNSFKGFELKMKKIFCANKFGTKHCNIWNIGCMQGHLWHDDTFLVSVFFIIEHFHIPIYGKFLLQNYQSCESRSRICVVWHILLSMKHLLVGVYQVCSNKIPGVKIKQNKQNHDKRGNAYLDCFIMTYSLLIVL